MLVAPQEFLYHYGVYAGEHATGEPESESSDRRRDRTGSRRGREGGRGREARGLVQTLSPEQYEADHEPHPWTSRWVGAQALRVVKWGKSFGEARTTLITVWWGAEEPKPLGPTSFRLVTSSGRSILRQRISGSNARIYGSLLPKPTAPKPLFPPPPHLSFSQSRPQSRSQRRRGGGG